jgi:hypothetical protein
MPSTISTKDRSHSSALSNEKEQVKLHTPLIIGRTLQLRVKDDDYHDA